MDSMRPQRVSVIDPVGPAVEQVRVMLFGPLDVSKWLTVGFCAWLATLGKGGMPTFNFNLSGHQHASDLSGVREAVLANLPWLIIGACLLIPLFIVLWLVFCWVSSRGQFMFVHCIAGNKGEVEVPWRRFARHANSLFLFRIVFAVTAAAVIGFCCVLAVIAFMAMQATGAGTAAAPLLIGFILLLFAAGVVVCVVAKFTYDFVVPIMFLHTASCLAGWREFLALLGCNKARLVLYILFQILISFVIAAITGAVCVIGCCCCCASALLLVPYVGTVLLLPLFAFTRSYSLFYLRQFGPQFDVFNPQAGVSPQVYPGG